jgi:hypothetical protein
MHDLPSELARPSHSPTPLQLVRPMLAEETRRLGRGETARVYRSARAREPHLTSAVPEWSG